VVEIVDQLNLKPLERAYRGSGSAPFHPALLLSVLVYGYATGVFSSRKLEHATYDWVAFRFVAAGEHPDHDTPNTFRKRFLNEIEGLMVQVLLIARALGVAKLGNVALDGSKIKANASKHRALSYGHIKKLEAQLKEEVAKLLALAEAADNEKIPDGMNLPDEIARREDRLTAIAVAKSKIFELSVASSIRGRSHPRYAVAPRSVGRGTREAGSASVGDADDINRGAASRFMVTSPHCGAPVLPYAVALLTAHTGTPFFPLTSPLYQRDPQSVKTCIRLVNGIKISSNSALSMCSASIQV
jgi:transposase